MAASRAPTSKPEPKGEPVATTSSIGLFHIIRSSFVPINDAFLQVPTNQRPVQFLKDISAVAVAIMKFLLLLLSLSAAANALHFFIDGTTPRCFYEELPKDTLVVGHYTAEEWDDRVSAWVKHDGISIYINVDVCFSWTAVHKHIALSLGLLLRIANRKYSITIIVSFLSAALLLAALPSPPLMLAITRSASPLRPALAALRGSPPRTPMAASS